MCCSVTSLQDKGALQLQAVTQDAIVQKVQPGVKCQGRDCCVQGSWNGVLERTASKAN